MYEKQVEELTFHIQKLSVTVKENEQLKKTVAEYSELAQKQDEVIRTLKDHRDSVGNEKGDDM